MKVIDKNGKIFGVVNVIDLFVLMIVAVLALFIFIKFGPSDNTQIDSQVYQQMSYTIKVEGVSKYTIEGAHKGDAVYDYETGSNIGVIVDVYDEPHKEYVVDDDDNAVSIESADKRDLFVAIEADFVETDRAYMVENTILAVGRKVLVYNKYLFVEGIIYSWDSEFND